MSSTADTNVQLSIPRTELRMSNADADVTMNSAILAQEPGSEVHRSRNRSADADVTMNSAILAQEPGSEVHRSRNRSLKRLKALFSCLLPQPNVDCQNRWNSNVKNNARFKWIMKNVITKVGSY